MRPYSVPVAVIPWAVVAFPAVVMAVWILLVDAMLDADGTTARLLICGVALLGLVTAMAWGRIWPAILGCVILVSLFAFTSSVPGGFTIQLVVLITAGIALSVVQRSRRRRNGRAWVEFTQHAQSAGRKCFVIGYAKPNGAQTTVNGYYLNQSAADSRNTSVWGRVPAGVTVAMDAGRRATGWVPTSFSRDAAIAERYRWKWW